MAASSPPERAASTTLTYQLVWEAAPGVVLIRQEGRSTIAGAHECVAFFNAMVRKHAAIFIATDAQRLAGYESGVRDVFSRWLGEHRRQVVANHMLVSSGMLKMAIQLTNLAHGGVITPHSDRAAFERAILAHAPDIDLSPMHVPIDARSFRPPVDRTSP